MAFFTVTGTLPRLAPPTWLESPRARNLSYSHLPTVSPAKAPRILCLQVSGPQLPLCQALTMSCQIYLSLSIFAFYVSISASFFIHRSTCVFNKYTLNTYYLPDTFQKLRISQ